VVLYHAGVPYITGGFTGVDIFFVISGYLLGGHIFSELRSGTFSFLRFYQRRAKRILPAFYVVLTFTILSGLLLLSPSENKLYVLSAFSATLSVSNIFFLRYLEGYFRVRSFFHPLLMTWSLGVEEQFYAVIPLLMVLLARIRRNWLLPSVLATCALSFVFAWSLLGRYPMMVFYTLPARAWELGAGVALAAAELNRKSRLLSCSGAPTQAPSHPSGKNRDAARVEHPSHSTHREKALVELLSREQPSHILVVGFAYKFFDPTRLRRIAGEFGARLFLYDTDSFNLYPRRREFIFFIENELPIYERVFSFSQVATRFFRETRNLDAVHLPFAAQPIELPAIREKNIDALFVGSCDLRRIFLLEGIRGSRWQRNFPLMSPELQGRIVDQPVWGGDLYHLFSRAKIVLNITRTDFFGVETGINLRLFEAVAAGCFLLTDQCPEISEHFEVGKEIEIFNSSGDLADKVRYYLENDEKRCAIARRGYEKFLKSHSWHTRIGQLNNHMNAPT